MKNQNNKGLNLKKIKIVNLSMIKGGHIGIGPGDDKSGRPGCPDYTLTGTISDQR